MRVYIQICGIDGGISVCNIKHYETLEDFAISRLSKGGFSITKEELYECEPYEVDKDILESEMITEGLIGDNTRIKDVKVIRAITYDAENSDEFQEIEVTIATEVE